MWHEARRQEKKIRGLMVDYQKRAERRREHYEKIKLDPTQFVRLQGQRMKIHLEPSVAILAEGPQSMQPWQGNQDIMIDRFDVRAHLDYIPDSTNKVPELIGIDTRENRNCHYESYRILVQNECVSITEEQHLHQIFVDEQFGAIGDKQNKDETKQKNAEKKAAIGFSYDNDNPAPEKKDPKPAVPSDEEEDSDLEDMDLDNVLDMEKLTVEQTQELNKIAREYGMQGDDYEMFLDNDKDEVEQIRLAKLLEEEKAQFSGRKSRRERRAFKEKRLQGRQISPPSYAARDSPKYEPFRKSSSSRSPSPDDRNGQSQAQFITSFGGSDDEGPVQGPLPPHLQPKPSTGPLSATARSRTSDISRFRKSSRSMSPDFRGGSSRASFGSSKSKSQRSRSRSNSRSRYDRHERRSRSYDRRRERDYRRSRSRSRRSRSRSRGRYGRSRRSRSRSYGYRRRSYSRSRSRDRRRRSYSRSRSRGRRSRSRSRSWNRHGRSRSRSRFSRSRTKSKTPPPVPIKRYRRPSLSSNSDSSDDEADNDTADETKTKQVAPVKIWQGNKLGTSSKGKLTPQERLKRRMQLALTKQQKADLRARKQKNDKLEQERMDREDELRTIAIEMRRREREKRHKERFDDDSPYRSRSTSRERDHVRSSYHSPPRKSPPRSRSPRRRSRSPAKRSSNSSRNRSSSPHRRKRSRSPRSSSKGVPRLVDY